MVHFVYHTDDANAAERAIHSALRRKGCHVQLGQGREWFEIDPQWLLDNLAEIVGCDLNVDVSYDEDDKESSDEDDEEEYYPASELPMLTQFVGPHGRQVPNPRYGRQTANALGHPPVTVHTPPLKASLDGFRRVVTENQGYLMYWGEQGDTWGAGELWAADVPTVRDFCALYDQIDDILKAKLETILARGPSAVTDIVERAFKRRKA